MTTDIMCDWWRQYKLEVYGFMIRDLKLTGYELLLYSELWHMTTSIVVGSHTVCFDVERVAEFFCVDISVIKTAFFSLVKKGLIAYYPDKDNANRYIIVDIQQEL